MAVSYKAHTDTERERVVRKRNMRYMGKWKLKIKVHIVFEEAKMHNGSVTQNSCYVRYMLFRFRDLRNYTYQGRYQWLLLCCPLHCYNLAGCVCVQSWADQMLKTVTRISDMSEISIGRRQALTQLKQSHKSVYSKRSAFLLAFLMKF